MTLKQTILSLSVAATAAFFLWLSTGTISDASPGKAEPRNTTWVLAVVSVSSPIADARTVENNHVYMDVVWQIAEGPTAQRLMNGSLYRLPVAASDPRLKELVPGTAIFISVPADMLADEGEKYTSYLGSYDDGQLFEFLLYREYPFWTLP